MVHDSALFFTRLRRKPRSPDRGGMRVSSEALAKEDCSFGGLRRNIGATGSCPWGSSVRRYLMTLCLSVRGILSLRYAFSRRNSN